MTKPSITIRQSKYLNNLVEQDHRNISSMLGFKSFRWAQTILAGRLELPPAERSGVEWSGRYAVALNAEDNTIHLSHSSLDVAFDDDGWQVNPLMARLSGRVADLEGLLKRCGLQAEPVSDISLPHQYVLTVRQGV